MSSTGFKRSENLQSPTYNTISLGECMYTAYNANGHQVVDERMAKEQMEGYSSIDSAPISAGWAPPVDWYTQQWAYGVSEIHSIISRNADNANSDSKPTLLATGLRPGSQQPWFERCTVSCIRQGHFHEPHVLPVSPHACAKTQILLVDDNINQLRELRLHDMI